MCELEQARKDLYKAMESGDKDVILKASQEMDKHVVAAARQFENEDR